MFLNGCVYNLHNKKKSDNIFPVFVVHTAQAKYFIY